MKKLSACINMQLIPWVASRRAILYLLAMLLVLRLALLLSSPLSLWNSSNDYAVHSLSHAIYLDERITTDNPTHAGYAQTIHPGIPFQIVSWLAYRVSEYQFSNFEERMTAAITDSSNYFFVSRLIPFVVLSLVFILIWGRVIKAVPIYYSLSLPLTYFSIFSSFTYGFIYLGNDTFALPLGILLFVLLVNASNSPDSKVSYWWLLAGMAGGLAYLNKLNYLMWSVGIIGGYFISSLYLRTRGQTVLSNIGLYLLGFMTTAVGLGTLYLGLDGFKEMLIRHKGFITHSGIYGSGAQEYFSLKTVVQNITLSGFSFPFFWSLVLVVLLQAGWVLSKRKDDRLWLKNNLPVLGSLFGAALMVMFASFKHYQSHYLVPLVVIVVCISWWSGAHSTSRNQRLIILPFVLLAFGFSLKTFISSEIAGHKRIERIDREIAKIKELPLSNGQTRLWAYHVPSKEYSQYFLSLLTHSSTLDDYLDTVNAVDKHFDIFSRFEDRIIDRLRWKYLIAQTGYFKDQTKWPDYVKRHGKLLVKYDELLVIENIHPATGPFKFQSEDLLSLKTMESLGDGSGYISFVENGIFIQPGITTPTRIKFKLNNRIESLTYKPFIDELSDKCAADADAGLVGLEVMADGRLLDKLIVDRTTDIERRLDLKGVKSLELIVSNGNGTPNCDRFILQVK